MYIYGRKLFTGTHPNLNLSFRSNEFGKRYKHELKEKGTLSYFLHTPKFAGINMFHVWFFNGKR